MSITVHAAVDCQGATWATHDAVALLLGNGHNPHCGKFVAHVNAGRLARAYLQLCGMGGVTNVNLELQDMAGLAMEIAAMAPPAPPPITLNVS